jgi:predicted nucleic acid-binding protein
VRAGDISANRALLALRAARGLIKFRYTHAGCLAESAWRWRDNLSFYDALYVALAARLEIPLVTGDSRLAKAPGLACTVELA